MVLICDNGDIFFITLIFCCSVKITKNLLWYENSQASGSDCSWTGENSLQQNQVGSYLADNV